MSKKNQSEAQLEAELIKRLVHQGYEKVEVRNDASIRANLHRQLELFNSETITEREMDQVLNHLSKGNIFDKAKTLRDRLQITRQDGEVYYLQFFDSEDWMRNRYQVTHQIASEGTYKTRFDVTILVNGLPLVQIELKRRGLEMKEAFQQICRYKRHAFWTHYGLFNYVQLFVISNGANTKYYANNKLSALTFKQTFFWAREDNRHITELLAHKTNFTNTFLDRAHLGKMIAQYIVFNETYKVLMVLRPYQYYAAEAISKAVRKDGKRSNGYIWHTTGSGKTLTSFKAAQILMDMPDIHKVVFVVDRKDLDYQTMKEFNSFKKDSVDVTDSTSTLVDQFVDDSSLILTTIQKLNNAITSPRFLHKMESLRDQRMVFIFDECHRSQFGATHKRITDYFSDVQMFGFTGTPIFAENARKNELGKRTTKDLFHKRLHTYVITDAIGDQNVLRFNVEYLGKYKNKVKDINDTKVIDIDKPELYNDPLRISKNIDYIIKFHDQKTHNKEFSAILATSSIPNLIQYYDIFQQKKLDGKHDLRIAAIFTYGTNEEDDEAQGSLPDYDEAYEIGMAAERSESAPQYETVHSREKLDAYIADYNAMYKTSFSTKDGKSFENYFNDISKRMKEREKVTFHDKNRLDIVLVVNMLLTGFDAKKVNTLYVDKNLRHHGLIQAFSRTNRILNEKKSQGNILCFRNLKESTDEAIALFSDKDANETILLPEYDSVVRDFNAAVADLRCIAPTYDSVNDLISEDDKLLFVNAFRTMMRLMNVLTSYIEFDWDDLDIDSPTYANYRSKYLDIREETQGGDNEEGGKESVLDDIDFEVELIHSDTVNVAYILKLLAKLRQTDDPEETERQQRVITELLSGDVSLRSKRKLIEKFISDNLPKIDDPEDIAERFDEFWEEERVLALGKLCEEENLDRAQFAALIDAYIYSEKVPIQYDIIACLQNRISVLKAKTISERILDRMKEYVQVFMRDMVG